MYRNSVFLFFWLMATGCFQTATAQPKTSVLSHLKAGFVHPPDTAKPGVYWYFMDGNLSAEGIRGDLKAMKKAGIGHVIFLEVNVGVPRGKINFLSPGWLSLFQQIEQEARKQEIAITLGIGPGWAGSGGPWVAPEYSMQHLVSSSTTVTAQDPAPVTLPVPPPKPPFFGEGALTPGLTQIRNQFYKDVAVLAFPAPVAKTPIADVDYRALYYRAPFSSAKDVPAYYPPVTGSKIPGKNAVQKNTVIDITDRLTPDGKLNWKPRSGTWIVMRFGVRNNGAVTRPAPLPGLGFEADKLDTTALNRHLDFYVGRILEAIGPVDPKSKGGLKYLHIDSWEMGAQNWTKDFRQEFIKRRHYDPLPFYPVYAGQVIGSAEISDRFLWDLRKTAMDLVLERHALHVKKYAYRNGLRLSIEPYDMNPTADLELGAVADIPMCEFWSKGFGFNTQFSCAEATSLGHLQGKPVIAAEAFTAQNNEAWKQYPGSMKNQGDWAFAAGINKFFYHTYQSQPLADSLKPGMTMGPYGVQWNRNQTWWSMADGYHQYIARCSYLLQQGNTVADILYLTPEEAPFVFTPPASALKGDADLRDRRGYNFDACPPGLLAKARVENGRICFPGGASYYLLVLPRYPAMSVPLLQKITRLVQEGATVIGPPPQEAPGLSGYPATDATVRKLAAALWGPLPQKTAMTARTYGKGRIIWGSGLEQQMDDLYCDYEVLAGILQSGNISENFSSDQPLRYTQRQLPGTDLFFISNTTGDALTAECRFRSAKKYAELWDPLNGSFMPLQPLRREGRQAVLNIPFGSAQSYFIIFTDNPGNPANAPGKGTAQTDTLSGSWSVAFDPKWGGPAHTRFSRLSDWKENADPGIRYYSGMAVYRKTFDAPAAINSNRTVYLDLGNVKQLARVQLNGQDLGVLWTAPWRVDITRQLRAKNNQLEITVANLWINRLIGDQQWPDDGVQNGKWPAWLLEGKPRPGKRYTFTTFNPYKKDDPLISSGLLGPVTLIKEP
ncbi:glycosyl hydrolase [Niabella drilacis]|uniref:Glycosyl hydrolases family 2, sugar binding domain n=1 Tax=Niabella drilacis (strain DSM 25811 / CCM 8410 / CCUG 62505 / LMG 26954 / E90) TaxID=1285928 RepID=A0A1G6ZGI1_NIADE|nr:glycosyl hydrolase [Niabella drilacis]SDE00816.1 Glycosyl hydrolases family 2, sugar binding domain [Niabella drilacis]